jgi:integrase
MLATRKRRPKRAADKRRLTELTIQKAKPKKGAAYLIWDTRQHGLAMRVQPSGAKAWKVIYSRHGKPRWLHLGRADAGGLGLADARKLAARAMLRVAEGFDPAAERRAQRDSGSFGELCDRYLEHAKRVNKSWRQARALLERHALPRWSKLQAASLTRADVRGLMAKITATAPVAANQVLASISAVFTWATKQELLPANPARGVDRNVTRSRERVLSESELPVFWKALDDLDDPVRAATLRAILLTGQRPGEIARMRREHLDGIWWTLPGEAQPEIGWLGTKNKSTHRIPLSQPVQKIIAEGGGNGTTGFIFAGARGGAAERLDEAMRALSKRLGIAPVRPHDLRRTWATTAASLGVGRQAIDRILNHADRSVGSIYDRHGYGPEDQRIMEMVAARIMALVEGREEETGKIINIPLGSR